MVNGSVNKQLLRIGLSVVAALLLSSATFAQDAVGSDDELVLNPVDLAIDAGGETGGEDPGFAVGEPDPNDAGEPDVVIDDGGVMPGDDAGADDGVVDDGVVEDEVVDDGSWQDPVGDDDTIIVIDDGLCIGVGCVPGDDSVTYDGGYGYDGEVVIYYMEGPRPEDCMNCRDLDLPVEAYQTTGGPLVTDTDAAVAAKPRRSSAAPSLAGDSAACLALHPQVPWLCEWQNGAGS